MSVKPTRSPKCRRLYPFIDFEIVVGKVARMKRKTTGKQEPVVPPEILEQAKRSLSEDRNAVSSKRAVKCTVCGDDAFVPQTASAEPLADSEPLCWVCRRLKISAWREVEQQLPAQE